MMKLQRNKKPLSIFATVGCCTYIASVFSIRLALRTGLLLQKTEKVASDSAVGSTNQVESIRYLDAEKVKQTFLRKQKRLVQTDSEKSIDKHPNISNDTIINLMRVSSMKNEPKSVTITISVDQDVKLSLEKFSKEIDLTVSKLSRNLIYTSLDDFKLLDKVKLGKQMLSLNTSHFSKSMKAYAASINQPEIEDDEISNTVQISVIIDSEIKSLLEEYAKKFNMNLKTFTSSLLYVGLHDLNLANKVGIMKFAVGFRDFLIGFNNFRKKK